MGKRNTDSAWDVFCPGSCVIPIRPLGSLYIFWVPLPTVFNAVTFPLYAIKTSIPLPPMCPPQIIQQPSWSSNGSIRYV